MPFMASPPKPQPSTGSDLGPGFGHGQVRGGEGQGKVQQAQPGLQVSPLMPDINLKPEPRPDPELCLILE